MTVEHFDAHARTWDEDPAKAARAHAVAHAIRQRLPLQPTLRALEYGCGTGLLGFALKDDLGHITLADSSPGMLAVLEEKIAAAQARHLRPLQLDLMTDPPPADRFDLIVSLMALHHVSDIDKALAHFHALLAPGGHLGIADLDAEDGSFHGEGFTGHKGFDRAALRAQALAAGFARVDFSTVFDITKGDGDSARRYPVFLMIAAK